MVLSRRAVLDYVELSGKPQPTERQHIGNQINAAMIVARANCVDVNAHKQI